MITRTSKLLLISALALFYTLLVFNNLTDFGSNYDFVRHVLSMDTTFPASHAHWRALPFPAAWLAFYWSIILWEAASAGLLWWGAARLAGALRMPAAQFQSAKRMAIAALTVSALMWLVAFLTVGGEWFLMWQSNIWNGQQEAFRMFVVVGIVILIVLHPDTELQQ